MKKLLATVCALTFACSAQAALLVYEGFDYPATTAGVWSVTGNTGMNGGIGFGGEWLNPYPGAGTANFNIEAGAPVWGALQTSSNWIFRDGAGGTEELSRMISATLPSGTGNEMWFSLLYQAGDNAYFNIGAGPSKDGYDDTMLKGPGFGFASTGNGLAAAVWPAGDNVDPILSAFTATARGTLVFLVGGVSFGTGADGKDVYSLYSVGTDLLQENATLIGTVEVDVDETLIDRIAFNTNRNPGFDEIRIGESYADVVAVSSEFVFNLAPSDSVTLSANYPVTLSTNSVVADFSGSALGVEITAINVSGDSNAFSTVTAPLTISDPAPSNAVLEFVFDATAVTNITGATGGFNVAGSVDIVWKNLDDNVLVTNTIALVGDFNNPVTDFNYDSSLNMAIMDPAVAVTNDISVSYVTGRPGQTNVQITAIDIVNATTNGFSVLTAPFTLPDPEPSNSVIQVVYDNSGGWLQNKESASADIVITWQEAGGITNYVATNSVSVNYLNMPEGVIQQFFANPTTVENWGDGKFQMNNFETGTNKWLTANAVQDTSAGYLWVKSGGNNRTTMNLIEGGTRGMDNFGLQDTLILTNGLYRYDFDFEMVRTPNEENMWGFGAYALIGQDTYDTNTMVNYVEMDLGTADPVYVDPTTEGSASYRVHPNGKLISSNEIARTTGSVYLNIQDGEDALFVIQSGGNAEPYVYELTLTRVGDYDPNTDTPNSPNAVLAADFDEISATNAIIDWAMTDTNADADTNGVSIANTWRGENISWENQSLDSVSFPGGERTVAMVIRRGTAGYDDVGVQDTMALTSGVYELTLDIDINDDFPTNPSAVRVEFYALSQDASGDVNQIRIDHSLDGEGYMIADGSAAYSLLGSKTYTGTATETLVLSDMNVLDGQDVALVIYQGYGPNLQIDNVELVRTGNAVLSGYDGWAAGYPGFFDTALDSDPEGDGINNLLEYALNGNPTTGGDSILPTSNTGLDGGTNWFYYVHTERTDDGTLTYTVEVNDNLVFGTWTNNAEIVFVGDSATVDNYKSVTNRTDIADAAEFLRLQVEKD